MFGFLRPAAGNVAYRQIYAGVCAAQHRQAGLRTLPLLSYEAVFLYQLAVDAGACEAPADDAARCCRLRKSGPRVYEADERITRFCSAFGLLLAATKLEDDVRDDRSWLARFALWWLKSPIRAARDFLAEREPDFPALIRGCIDRHLQYESGQVVVDWRAYAEPTADAFAAVFALFAGVLAEANDDSKSVDLASRLSRIGGEIGRAIIFFDCAVDWQQDRRRGRYNPLPNRGHVHRALAAAQQSLATAGWLCCEAWGEHCGTAKVLRAAFDRLARRIESSHPSEDLAVERARRWPTRPARGPHALLRRGDCDGCCDAASGCDGCSSCGEADGCCHICDAAGPPASRFGCLVDCCPCEAVDCCYCDNCWPDKRKKTHSAANEPAGGEAIGFVETGDGGPSTIGRAVGSLRPFGMVEVAGQRHPARSASGFIEDGTEVVVTGRESFGLVVQPLIDSELA